MTNIKRTWRLGRDAQKLVSFCEKLARTGSIAERMVPHSPATTRKSVMQATMHKFDSFRMLLRAESREAMLEQSMTSELLMVSREDMLRLVMLRRTLLSPTTEIRRDIMKRLSAKSDQLMMAGGLKPGHVESNKTQPR